MNKNKFYINVKTIEKKKTILLDLAKELWRNKRTLISNVEKRNIIPRKKTQAGQKGPNGTSASIYPKVDINPKSKKGRCSALNEIVRNVKLVSKPSLNQTHKKKRFS